MPDPKKGLLAHRLEQAKIYVLAHPDESKLQQVVGSGYSDGTIAKARAILVAEGKLPKDRKKQSTPVPQTVTTVGPEVRAATPDQGLRDHEAMKALADMIEQLEEMDDAAIQKKLAKQALAFAFNQSLHPDTRMSASQMYYKLRDMSKAKDLGPGNPVTFADGVARLADLFRACGPEMVMAGVNEAFTVKEPANGETNDEAKSAGGSSQETGSPGHPSEAQEAEVLRTVRVDGNAGPPDGTPGDIRTDDLSGPPA